MNLLVRLRRQMPKGHSEDIMPVRAEGGRFRPSLLLLVP